MCDHYDVQLIQTVSGCDGAPCASDRRASAQHAAPFLSIVVNALGPEEAHDWFAAFRRAHRREAGARQSGTYRFGFAFYLSVELDEGQEPTLARASAWEALKAVHEIVSQDPAADLDALLARALRATVPSSADEEPTAALAALGSRHE